MNTHHTVYAHAISEHVCNYTRQESGAPIEKINLKQGSISLV